MMDTAVHDDASYAQLVGLTEAVERERAVPERMKIRAQRIAHFVQYLSDTETHALSFGALILPAMPEIRGAILDESDRAVSRAARNYG